MQGDVQTENVDELAEALDLLLEQMDAPPLHPKVWEEAEITELYQCAYYFYRSGKYAEAVDCFRTLTTINCRDADYWTGLAGALKMNGQHDRALEAYSMAALIDHSDPALHAHAADCCFALGQIERGLSAIESAEILAAGHHKYQQLLSQLAVIKQAWSNDKIADPSHMEA